MKKINLLDCADHWIWMEEDLALAQIGTESHGHLVGLPNVNFCAAASILSSACVFVGVAGHPVLHVGLSVDDLQVMRLMGCRMTKPKLRSCVAVLAFSAVGVHLDKVQCTVQATVQIGVVNGVGEFLVFQLENPVGIVVVHQESAGAHVGAVITLRDKSNLLQRVCCRTKYKAPLRPHGED